MLRLIIFDVFYGQRLAFVTLVRRLGWQQATFVSVRVLWRLCFKHPFRGFNGRSLTSAEACSQRQLAPALVLYDVLVNCLDSEPRAREVVQAVVNAFAPAYLQFSIPQISAQRVVQQSSHQREQYFTAICRRFFNARGRILVRDERLEFRVHLCFFASYCRQLGYPQLAPVFCAADARYFVDQQPDVVFARTQTLANGDAVCDFSFQLKQQSSTDRSMQ